MTEDSKAQAASRLEKQIGQVMKAIQADPAGKARILTTYIFNFFGAVKETIRRQGRIMPLYIIVTEPVQYGVPPVTEEVTRQAKASNAEALICVEGFQSEKDLGDVIYHVSISAPCLGVMGWVLKVNTGYNQVTFAREMPYHFETPEKIKSLGRLIAELEGA